VRPQGPVYNLLSYTYNVHGSITVLALGGLSLYTPAPVALSGSATGSHTWCLTTPDSILDIWCYKA
jgi:hypothetical protein